MAFLSLSLLPSNSFPFLSTHPFLQNPHNFKPINQFSLTYSPPKFTLTHLKKHNLSSTQIFSSGGNGGGIHGGGNDGGGGGGGGGGDDGAEGKNREEAFLVMAEVGRSLDSLPKDLASAVDAGRTPGSILGRFFELEKSPVFRWLLQFGGFKERLLADDLFLTKVGIECGIGIFTKVGIVNIYAVRYN